MTDSQGRAAVLKAIAKMGMVDFELTECSFTLTSVPITAPARRLTARWTLEEEQTVEAEVDPAALPLLKKILDDMQAHRCAPL